MNIDKTEANERLAAIEAEAAKLREIINRPEREDAPKPKPGEVWKCAGEIYCISNTKAGLVAYSPWGNVWSSTPVRGNDPFGRDLYGKPYETARLGTFDEVFIEREKVSEDYILRSEVREVVERALTLKDLYGDRFIDCAKDRNVFMRRDLQKVVDVLKELL